ncbi:MAG TPA: hypothetical protein VMV77_02680 [Bacteroidales bacterium]|nr:hypothetical protein [Bacteroidales bacterium]
MKKTLLIVVIILAVLIALPVINLIRWTFQSKKPLDIILVDKTVPTLERVKHKSFNWILTNERFVKKEKRSSYSFRKNYYGFYPQRPLRDKKWERNDYRLTDLINLAEKNDAVYFADTYGIFFNDWYGAFNRSRKSRKIYGGLNNNDFLLIKEMKDRNKLIIMEYNSFDYPTAQFESVRTQEKLGIKFAGWTGKYFSKLDTTSEDFPIWMTAIYRKQYRKPWTFTKPGIVILKDKDIIVLEEGIHLKNAVPHIITDSLYIEKYGVPSSVAFDRWFDIIDPLENNIISKYRIETTLFGDTVLYENNLSSEFPAVVQEPPDIYYFAGDFASNNIPVWTSRFVGVEKLKVLLYSKKPDDTRRFFWLYYRPLINGIFTDYYDSVTEK